MSNAYASGLTVLPIKRTLVGMKTIRATNLRKTLYESLETLKKNREPVEVVLGGQPAAILMPSPTLKPEGRKPPIDLDAVAAFCKKYRIKSFALFGSILRHDFNEKSDVDVLIDVDHFFDIHIMFRMVDELEAMFGRKVDMVERSSFERMHPLRREEISSTARIIYEEKAYDDVA